MTELKPCPKPWCEAKARGADFSPNVYSAGLGNLCVSCPSCRLKGPLRSTEAEAILAWNTRPTDAAAEALAEAGKKALNFIENTESELGIELDGGNALRTALTAWENLP